MNKKIIVNQVFILIAFNLALVVCEQSYTVANEQLEAFEGEDETLVDFSKLKVVGRQRMINGSLSILEDMDDDNFKFSVELYSSPNGDGDFKRMAMDVPQTSICEGYKKFYVQFAQPSLKTGETTDFPQVDDNTCPIPKGSFYIKNISFNTEDWPHQVPRGIIKAVVTYYKEGKNVGGIIIVVKIEDRQS